MSMVVIGMDPHKRSATIEVIMASDETVLGRGRYGTCESGYRAMVRAVRRWPERTWAIEGYQSIGRHIAMRLIAARCRLRPGLSPHRPPRSVPGCYRSATLSCVLR